ncbi:MAG: bacillithiol biosynthesis deacetylase BshB1 [Planctomyces sp.]|nr:bacillithiol biosynthesis deacetylase BshB1 [Planctomyces sp.]
MLSTIEDIPLDLPPLDVLCVAPHPDDAEISVGGSLLKWHRLGQRVGVLDLTSGEPTPFGSRELRQAEAATATKLLELDFRFNLGLPNRSLEPTLDNRRAIAEVFRLTKPRVILAPWPEDAHPDHVAATQLIEGARFWSKLTKTTMAGEPYHPPRIFYYWSIHLKIQPTPAFVVDISETIEPKMESVAAYASQFTIGRTPTFPTAIDDIRDRARYWGWAIGRAYGEPIGSREALYVDDLSAVTGLALGTK